MRSAQSFALRIPHGSKVQSTVRQSPQVKVHTHVTPGQREVFMRYGHACALMSSGCGYPVLLMRLHTKDTIFIGIGNHTILFTASLYCTQVPTTFSTERSGRGRSATHSCATSHVACDASHSSDHLGLEQSTPKASYIESPQYPSGHHSQCAKSG